jgi:hypothetical protein
VIARQQKQWSLTGAARAAREARIDTVKHLREAPIARLWHMGKLQRAFQFQAASTGDPGAAAALAKLAEEYVLPHDSSDAGPLAG